MTSHPTVLPTSRLRALIKCTLFVVVTALMFVPVLVIYALRLEKIRGRTVQLFFKIIGVTSGLRFKVSGKVSAERPLMLVANHSSYLDIFALGSLVPLSFTPKLEIRSWPLIGFFCVLADCVFVERRPKDMQRAQEEMAERLKTGKVLALFPEGTTGDGITVMPFKSGFFSLAEMHKLPVQPVSIAYTHVAGQPLNVVTRDYVSWIGDADFVTHYWRLLKLPSVNLEVTFYEVLRMENFADRKAISRASETIIREGLKKTLESHGVTS